MSEPSLPLPPATEPPAERLARLRTEMEQRGICRPGPGATQVVFGAGNPNARLVLVGEAPGAQEDREGKPFVGPAGRLLDEALALAGISRADVWITNVVKYRPVRFSDRRLANRPPTTAEVRACLPVLKAELAIIQPRAIVCLGATAASAIVKPGFRMNAERGKWLVGPEGIPTLVTFHPAYLLRQHGHTREQLLRLMVEDLRHAAEKAGLVDHRPESDSRENSLQR